MAKDAHGHGSDTRGGNVTDFAAHQQSTVEAMRKAVMPDLSKVTKAPQWIINRGLAAKRAQVS